MFYFSLELISSPLEQNICKGENQTFRCEKTYYTNFTIIINEALHGVKSVSSNDCGYMYIYIFSLFYKI